MHQVRQRCCEEGGGGVTEEAELDGIKVRADAMRRLGITDPHVVDEEYRKWMAGRLAMVGDLLSRVGHDLVIDNLSISSMKPRDMAATIGLCAGMMHSMASMLAEPGKKAIVNAGQAQAAEKETRAARADDNPVFVKGVVKMWSSSGAAFLLEPNDGKPVWIPKSQVSTNDDLRANDGRTVEVLIPKWLAEKKGLV